MARPSPRPPPPLLPFLPRRALPLAVARRRFIGVSWHKSAKMWTPCIKVNHKSTTLGYFKDEEAAARRYDEARGRTFPRLLLPCPFSSLCPLSAGGCLQAARTALCRTLPVRPVSCRSASSWGAL